MVATPLRYIERPVRVLIRIKYTNIFEFKPPPGPAFSGYGERAIILYYNVATDGRARAIHRNTTNQKLRDRVPPTLH